MKRKGQIQEPKLMRLRTNRILGGRQGSVLAFSHADQSKLVWELATVGKQHFSHLCHIHIFLEETLYWVEAQKQTVVNI